MRTPIVVALLACAVPAAAATKRPQAPVVDPASLVAVPAGAFTMGQPPEAQGPYGQAWFVDQQPAHEVTLRAFSLDRRETTVAEYARFLSYAGGAGRFHADQPIERVAGGYLPLAGADDEPMRHVTWADAAAYCAWAGKRLPTEAEWERAAAGVEGREYPWGADGPTCERAAFFTEASFCDPGSREAGATPDGILDLAGGVAEWVADRYGPYPAGPVADPVGPADGALRVVRGGSLVETSLWLRTRARWGAAPERHSANIGIRCAWDETVADAALRGALEPIADAGRVPTDRPLAPAAPGPELLAGGLRDPGPVVRLGDAFFALERGAGRILRVAGSAVTPVASDLGAPVGLATDGTSLFVTDRGGGRVLRVEPADGAVEVLAADQPELGPIAVDTAGPVWRSGTALRSVAGTLVDVPGLRTFALAGDRVVFGTDGAGAPAETYVGSVPRAGGELTRLVDETFGTSFVPTHVTMAGELLYLVISYRSFPDNSWLCPLDPATGAGDCVAAGPPVLDVPLAVAGARVVAAGRSTLYRLDLDATPVSFRTVALWTRPGGLATGDGAVVWTDPIAGRIHRATIE
jgi:formylglycine-generating enzyme required for sulfatase activity